MNWSAISELFDPYARVARLYPAAIALLPLVWTLPVFGVSLDISIPEGVMATALGGALFYFMTTVARFKGKESEQHLLSLWGGWPTSILLRHRDPRIDGVTKARYHARLQELIGVGFPSSDAEMHHPEDCDALYRSATKALIEVRRDDVYLLLHKENASYGFRRNLYGLKPLAVSISLGLAGVAAGVVIVGAGLPSDWGAGLALISANKRLVVAIALDGLFAACLLLFVTPSFVLQSALDYAYALLRTLDAAKTPG